MHVVLLGAPGAGKGTQAEIVSDKTGLMHVASGNLFRHAVHTGTEIGEQVRAYMLKGELAPDELTIRVIMQRVCQPDCMPGCIFDGFPRTLEQAKALDEKLVEHKMAIDKAILIDVPDDHLLKRLTSRWTCINCLSVCNTLTSPPKVPGKCDRCGGNLYQRPDDKEHIIRDRIKVYNEQTKPVLEYYKKAGKLVSVDGTQEIEGIANEIISIIKGQQG